MKPNLAELADLLGYVSASRQEIQRSAIELRARFGADVIAASGGDGSVAVLGDRTYFIPPLAVLIVSTAGAGGGVLAGTAFGYLHQQPPEYGLQHGFALAAAILGTLATADFSVERHHELLPQVRVTPLSS